MKKGLLQVNWNDIEKYSQEDITYFLFLEGKSMEAISKIRGLSRDTVQTHIINGKINYGFFAKSENEKQLIRNISKAGKLDKLSLLKTLNEDLKDKLIKYIRNNYVDMYAKEKETAIWIIGELKEKSCNDILLKASVHKFTNVRRMSISAMGKIADLNFEVPLIRALEDENSQVVLYAIKALKKINSKRAIDKIEKICNSSDKDYIKKAASVYLEDINLDNKD